MIGLKKGAKASIIRKISGEKNYDFDICLRILIYKIQKRYEIVSILEPKI